MSRVRPVANPLASALAMLVVAAPMACGSKSPDAEPEHLHVLVQRLPQCDYGVGYEQPLRIELLHHGEVVATSWHGGTYTGEESLLVPLHAPDALPGRYTIRFGRCPSLVDDPAAAAACEDPDWFRRVRVRLRPAGMAEPQVVEYYRVRARCLETPVVPGAETDHAAE